MVKPHLLTYSQERNHFNDQTPALERATTWNNCSGKEILIRLADHLQGRALQEYSLMSQSEIAFCKTAVPASRKKWSGPWQ